MRVLVAGATSVPGLPPAAGTEVPRPRGRRADPIVVQSSQIDAAGARSAVADVFDTDDIDKAVADIGPEVVVSLLTTLPKWGPKRPKDFEPAKRLWSTGASNLVGAAQRAGVRRIVAESVIFAYGYPTTGPDLMDETDPYPGPPPKGGEEMLAALRGMEQNVLTSAEHSGTEGIVLRYGAFYRPGVPHDELFTRMVKLWAMPALTGNGIVRGCTSTTLRPPPPTRSRRGVAGRSTTSSTTVRSRSATMCVSSARNCTDRVHCRSRLDCSV